MKSRRRSHNPSLLRKCLIAGTGALLVSGLAASPTFAAKSAAATGTAAQAAPAKTVAGKSFKTDNSGRLLAPWATSGTGNRSGVSSRVPTKVERVGPLKIMPLGASITEGAYRATLAKDLEDAGVNFDLVGTQSSGSGTDTDHEGYPGYCAANCSPGKNLNELVENSITTTDPDVILLHVGTNDVTNGATASKTAANLDQLLDEIFAAKPDVQVLLAENVVRKDQRDQVRRGYNALMPRIVEQQIAAGNSVALVKMGGLLKADDLADTVHPDAEGYAAMGHAWFKALRPYL